MMRTKEGAPRARTAAVALECWPDSTVQGSSVRDRGVKVVKRTYVRTRAHMAGGCRAALCDCPRKKWCCCATVPYAGAVGGADKRNGVKSQSKDKQGSGTHFHGARGRYRRLTLSTRARPRYSPTQPHTTTHPTASIPPIPNLRDCLTSISSLNLNLDLVHRETSLPPSTPCSPSPSKLFTPTHTPKICPAPISSSVAELQRKLQKDWEISPSPLHHTWINSKSPRLVVINSVCRNCVEHHAGHNMLTRAGLRCAHSDSSRRPGREPRATVDGAGAPRRSGPFGRTFLTSLAMSPHEAGLLQ